MSPKTVTASQLRSLPSIDSLLRTNTAKSLKPIVGLEHLTALAREVTDKLRQELMTGQLNSATENAHENDSALHVLSEAERRLAAAHQEEVARGVRRVINATGVILHTNLGRAPLSAAARFAVGEEAAGYCNLEFDLNSGNRGRRGARAEDLLTTLTGTEAALVVNNCAAAALLVLTVLARDGQTIVSRGELVEIGGDFRVPEVMAQSGTRMVEVGTTNRTKLSDYQKAITDETRLIMRVHTSNYRIVGFTKTPTLKELSTLAHENGLLLYEDAGSGAIIDFTEFGITGEPIIRESFAAGVDVISFSGDKLLGGPQAGLLVGRAEVIEQMRGHSLYRALRADKLRIAALEATLESYAQAATASEIPTHRMISTSFDELNLRVLTFIKRVQESSGSHLHCEMIEGESAVGGGAAPTSRLRTPLISITHAKFSANHVEEHLRQFDPPVIARIEDDRVLLDLRTVAVEDEAGLASAVIGVGSI